MSSHQSSSSPSSTVAAAPAAVDANSSVIVKGSDPTSTSAPSASASASASASSEMGGVLRKAEPALVAAAIVTAGAAATPASKAASASVSSSSAVSARMPTFFLSHGGGPCFYMKGGFMKAIDSESKMANWFRAYFRSKHIPAKPKAIVMVSAHWETDRRLSVYSMTKNSMFYDYGGFPRETYAIKYDAPGAPDVASRVVSVLGGAGFPCDLERSRGLDHGAFNLLHVMYPDADIPVVQLSLLSSMNSAEHLAIGKALAPLRDEGILLCGSGDLTHTFGPSQPSHFAKTFDAFIDDVLGGKYANSSQNVAAAWASASFDKAAASAVTPVESAPTSASSSATAAAAAVSATASSSADAGASASSRAAVPESKSIADRNDRLVGWRKHPMARIAHPTPDHFMPMLVMAGAGLNDDATKVYHEFPFDWWSVGCWRFG